MALKKTNKTKWAQNKMALLSKIVTNSMVLQNKRECLWKTFFDVYCIYIHAKVENHATNVTIVLHLKLRNMHHPHASLLCLHNILVLCVHPVSIASYVSDALWQIESFSVLELTRDILQYMTTNVLQLSQAVRICQVTKHV